MAAQSDGRIPVDVLRLMSDEVDHLVDPGDERGVRFRDATRAYRAHRNAKSEPTFRTELATRFVTAVPENALDPSRDLPTVIWRAVERCSAGESYRETRGSGSPLEVVGVSTKQLRVYVSDGQNYWKVIKLWLSSDGSVQIVNHIDQLINLGKAHQTYHPSGVYHDRTAKERTRWSIPYWPDFAELDIIPLAGCLLCPSDYYWYNLSLLGLWVPVPEVPSVVLELPSGYEWCSIDMWLGRSAVLRDDQTVRSRLVPVLTDKILKLEFVRVASFRDPSDGSVFDIDLAIAQTVRAEDVLHLGATRSLGLCTSS